MCVCVCVCLCVCVYGQTWKHHMTFKGDRDITTMLNLLQADILFDHLANDTSKVQPGADTNT